MEKIKSFVKTHKTLLALIAAGFLYGIFTQITGWYVPCMVRLMTGMVCPGCGISHLCTDLMRFRFADAVRENYAIAFLSPVWAVTGIAYKILQPKGSKKVVIVSHIVMWGSVVVLMVFAILRNLPGFEYLKPLYLQR